MPASTPNGLPYPLPTDQLQAGAADIQALAEELDSRVAFTGDYKISAQLADHGEWLLCDGTPIDAAHTELIALVGPNRPDARGRLLSMKGPHALVDTIGKGEGLTDPASRSPSHYHRFLSGNRGSGSPAMQDVLNYVLDAWFNTSGAGALDMPSFVVPGNLFVHT
jgi:hypothetical protein